MKISRAAYAEMFGPTIGDRVRLADTDLVIEVEKDFTVYGDEVKFGGGKVIRDGMGQSQRVAKDSADTVITNALVIDWWGIVKCDIAIKDGKIAKLGKALLRISLLILRNLEIEGQVVPKLTPLWQFTQRGMVHLGQECDYLSTR